MRAVKVPSLKGGVIGSRRETCVYLGGPAAMVPCLHHGNIYMKRKLWVWRNRMKRKLGVWRDQKLIFLSGANTALTCADRQSTQSQRRRYRAEKGYWRILGWTYRHGTVFAPWQYLYEKEATGMDRPEMHFPSRCKNRTYLCGQSKYPVSREAA